MSRIIEAMTAALTEFAAPPHPQKRFFRPISPVAVSWSGIPHPGRGRYRAELVHGTGETAWRTDAESDFRQHRRTRAGHHDHMHRVVDLKVLYFGTPVVLIGTRNPDGTAKWSSWRQGRSPSVWWERTDASDSTISAPIDAGSRSPVAPPPMSSPNWDRNWVSEMACVVVYDANVLYGNTLRDMMIRVARSRLVQAKWSDRILDEALENLAARRPDIERAKLDRPYGH
ncbi:hypothetical protein ACWCPQ_20745 [Nocardia sp. NPDC001965]